MMNNDNELKDINEAELLLPWYVAGTLSKEESQKVETWLNENPEAEAHLARATEEMDTTITASEEIPMPRADAVNDLMAAIGADKPQATTSSFIDRLWDMLSPRYAMAGAAALALVVLGQATTIGVMMNDQPPAFETASGGAVVVDGPSALVAFNEDISLSDITEYLSAQNLTIVDGPKPGGVFRIAAMDSDEGKAALEALGANAELVRFFAETGQ